MEVTRNADLPDRPLSVRVSAKTSVSAEDPMSPTGRIMEDMGIYIVVVMGLGAPVNLPVFRAGIETELLTRFPRFRSIPVVDGRPRWVETMVNVDDHIIVPRLDPSAVAYDPEKAVEDYVASLSTLPMDRHRPPWEFHFLDVPTSHATSTAVLRLHHSIGDGTSIISLLMASSRSTAEPTRLPAMPPPPKRTGTIYQRRPRPPLSSGKALLAWAWSYLVLAWNTLVDGVLLVATVLFLSDPRTLLTRPDCGGDGRRKRFVHRSLNFDDVKLIKTFMNCTVNDALVGVTSAALSRYYFRKSDDINTKIICLRSFLPVNIRPVFSGQIGAFITRLFLIRTTISLSNIVGPAENITLCGHPVAFMAISVYGHPQAMTVHYLNYGSTIEVILAVDDEQFPDGHELLDDFSESMRLIKNAALKISNHNAPE